MKKRILAIAAALTWLLAGCSAETSEESSVSASPSAVPSAVSTASMEVPDQLEIIDGVVEEDLPRTLRITIQDMEVIFTKADAYTCADELNPGDSVKVYYDGDLENHPAVYEAEKE
ncbi:hypothetical protein [Anaerolactibacter massiliensis]|jgi:PBP1b-binding outer membrane lipoprotein LpoB|uniref:hypothetical protein n=1 Tax=Anaerolactibacter massiliensis TaxID=2044573 RepID=UPI000CF9DF78|nr:hypothetical protein [Anaerolactibacter massiliensis]MDD7679569.1 hypothetical protein [Stecheria intestinalis]MDY4682682.1 hypothetical protein [Lachnospiraceae bacterium]